MFVVDWSNWEYKNGSLIMVVALNNKSIEVYNINNNHFASDFKITPKKLTSFNVDEEVSTLAFDGRYIATALSNG